MRPQTVRMAAAGYSGWVPVDRLQNNFNVYVGVKLSSGAVLTYTVQYTSDDLWKYMHCEISRSTTTATLKLINHGLSVGDNINVQGSGSSNLDGSYQVASVVDADNITYTVSNTGATADTGDAKVSIGRVFSHITLVDQTASADGNFVNSIQACRLYVSAYTSGLADMTVLQGTPA